MTVNEFWARLGINAVIVVIGLVVLASGLALGGLIAAVGVIGGVWTVARAVTQTRRMNAAIAAKRAGQSS